MFELNRSLEDQLRRSINDTGIDIAAIKQFVWANILPPLCLIGAFNNSINVAIFVQRKRLKNSIYKYFLWHSVFDLVYLLICFIRFVLMLETFRDIHFSYWMQLFEAYGYIFSTNSLAMLMILIELIIAIKRLLIIMNTSLVFRLKFRTVIFVCCAIAVSLSAPFTLSIRIVDQKYCNFTVEDIECLNLSEQPLYVMTHENVPYQALLKGIYLAASILRGFVAPLALIFINLSIGIKFRQICRRKNYLTTTVNSSYYRKLRCLQGSYHRLVYKYVPISSQ